MQSRLLKGLALALVAVALPVVAFAQNSRVEGLNVQGDYIKDYTNIFTYTSCITGVGNLVYGEFGTVNNLIGPGGPTKPTNSGFAFTTDDRAVGAVLGNLWDGKFGTWSFHIRDNAPNMGAGNADLETALLGSDPNFDGEGNESFDIMWGKKFGTTSLGLRVNRTNFLFKPNAGTDTKGDGSTDRNIMGFGGGVGFEINPKTSADVSVLYQSRTFVQPGATQVESDGGAAFLISGRLMWQWQPNVMVVPVFKYYSFDLSTTSTTPPAAGVKTESTRSGWQGGVAGNWTLNTNDLFVAGITFASNVNDQKTAKIKDTFSASPELFAALETHVNPWLTLRFGGSKAMFANHKSEDNSVTPGTTTETHESFPFIMHLGAGVKLGTLQFDGVLFDDFFHNPTTYMFGNNAAPLFTRVGATYSF